MAYAPFSLESLPVLLPTAVSLAGVWLKHRSWSLLGTTLLVIAPQLALVEVIIALAALALPYVSIAYRPPR